jgi:Uma2 family endonuclease
MPSPAAASPDARFSGRDYRGWPDDERWELIDGVPIAMAPAPSIAHQRVVGRLHARLTALLAGHPCEPFVAPVDVKLSEHDVVQPDVAFVCRAEQITDTHIEGAPGIVSQVLWPKTSARDLREKKALYERAGVAVYVVVDPLERCALVFSLTDGRYHSGAVVAADEALVLGAPVAIELPLAAVVGEVAGEAPG